MKICRECGTPSPETTVFCPICGMKFPLSPHQFGRGYENTSFIGNDNIEICLNNQAQGVITTITPQDIQNVRFERSGSGYNMRQVDDFLDLLAAHFSAIIVENENLRSKMKILETQQGGSIKGVTTMITLQDIQNVRFERSGSGYNMRQVDDFLDLLAAHFSAIIVENENLRSKLKILEIP